VKFPQLVERRRKHYALTWQIATKTAHIKDFLARRKQQVDAVLLNDARQFYRKCRGCKTRGWNAKGTGDRAAIARYPAWNAVRNVYGVTLGRESARVVKRDRGAPTQY
jgi:hypothetical protein